MLLLPDLLDTLVSLVKQVPATIAAKGVINVILLKMNCCQASDNHLP